MIFHRAADSRYHSDDAYSGYNFDKARYAVAEKRQAAGIISIIHGEAAFERTEEECDERQNKCSVVQFFFGSGTHDRLFRSFEGINFRRRENGEEGDISSNLAKSGSGALFFVFLYSTKIL